MCWHGVSHPQKDTNTSQAAATHLIGVYTNKAAARFRGKRRLKVQISGTMGSLFVFTLICNKQVNS